MAQEELTESVFDAGHRALQSVDPSAFLVWPRILRRLVMQDQELTGIHWHVPHRKCYVVSRERLLTFVAPDELGLTSSQSVPDRVILISRPDRDDLVVASLEALEGYLWRLLFHARVHAHLNQLIESKQLTVAIVRARIDQIGQSEFDEIRSVLEREHFLFPEPKEIEVYAEFVALYSELKQFSPKWRHSYFPSIHDFAVIDETIGQDLNAAEIFANTKLPQALPPEFTELSGTEDQQNSAADDHIAAHVPQSDRIPPGSRWAERTIERLVQQSEKAAANGNSVRAAVLVTQACQYATDEHQEQLLQLAGSELARLTQRLQAAVGFDEADANAWNVSLAALVRNSLHGFWNNDARLLYDLQKVCVDHEREISVISLMGWICSFGRKPIKRPLPNQREVLMSKHLRSATARLPTTALTSSERNALSRLLNAAAKSAEDQLRKRLRPLLSEALVRVGLNPQNVPERVARQKLVEEMSDAIVRRGFLTIGNLRDTMSRNNLKLSDLETVQQVLNGDQLLRADRQLSELLDGVYYPGEFYMRWLQRLSSLAFGTPIGRFFTQYVAIPFGASFVILKGLDHLLHLVMGLFTKHTPAVSETLHEGSEAVVQAATHSHHEHPAIIATVPVFLALGLFLLALIHVRLFRKAIAEILRLTWKAIRSVAYDTPRWFFKLPLVQAILHSPPAVLFRRYLLLPLASTIVVAAFSLPWMSTWTQWWYINGMIWLVLSIVLNSRLGRDFEELSSEWLMSLIHKIGVRFFLSLFDFVLETFKRLLEFIERVLYAVDEWLRFKSGESQVSLILKAILGVGWAAIAFVVRFWVNLLIEPQINPIKHFPVVTVSHKIILPMQPFLTSTLEKWFNLSAGMANTLAAVAVFFAPGMFGFLVWELKENWRLFAANRANRLLPVLIGSHGESLIRLMKPGFHSGTLPKLYSKLRRAERKSQLRRWKTSKAVYRDRLHHVEEEVHHFIERELVALLYESRGWGDIRLKIGHVEAASNSLKIELECPALAGESLWLQFEEQSGWLVANIMRSGWLTNLTEPQLAVFKLALAGIYKIGGVDLIREQIGACFNNRPLRYDISDQGLIVWPDRTYGDEVRYQLIDRRLISPRPRRIAREHNLVDIDARALIYSLNPISWKRWVDAWTAESEGHSIPALFPLEIQLLPQCVVESSR